MTTEVPAACRILLLRRLYPQNPCNPTLATRLRPHGLTRLLPDPKNQNQTGEAVDGAQHQGGRHVGSALESERHRGGTAGTVGSPCPTSGPVLTVPSSQPARLGVLLLGRVPFPSEQPCVRRPWDAPTICPWIPEPSSVLKTSSPIPAGRPGEEPQPHSPPGCWDAALRTTEQLWGWNWRHQHPQLSQEEKRPAVSTCSHSFFFFFPLSLQQ